MKNSRTIKTVLRGIPIVLTVLIILGYSYFRSQDYLNGPQVIILTPQNGETTDNPLLIIQGQTKNIANISLNDRKIFIDKEGVFTEKILLHSGYNIITVEAADKFNKNIKKRIEIVYQEKNKGEL